MKRTVVLVSGIGNSGKTTAIRRFLELNQVYPMHEGDVTIVLPLLCCGRPHVAGVATGGDNLFVVNRNIEFITPHEPQFIVFASKSYGVTVQRITEFTENIGAELIQLQTRWVANRAHQRSDRDRVAQQIQNAFHAAANRR